MVQRSRSRTHVEVPMPRHPATSNPNDSPKNLFLTALLFGVSGFLIVGLVINDSLRVSRTLARTEHLHPISVAALQDTPAGRDVLLEGQISERTIVRFHTFVAYVHERKPSKDWAIGW